jgi:hypothetical protein
MNKIPSDINDLMWKIAEKRDAIAAKEFSEKYPALAKDMQERIRMVSGMKEMRTTIAPAFVPAFKPKYMPPRSLRWKRYAPLALGLCTFAAASYYVTQNLVTPLPDLSSHFPTQATTTAKPSSAPTIELPSQVTKDNSDSNTPRPFTHGDSSTDAGVANQKPPVELEMSNVPLQSAMRAVARSWSLTLEIPPKTPNPTLPHVDMFGRSGMDFLNQLATENGLTITDEGNGHILVGTPRDAIPVAN